MLELSEAASKKSNLVRLLEATLGSLSTQLLSEMTETEKGTKNLLIRSVACDLKICLNYRQENVISSQKWSGCKIVYYCWSFFNLFFFFTEIPKNGGDDKSKAVERNPSNISPGNGWIISKL